MNKFKNFIVTKVLRVPIYQPGPPIVIKREQRQIYSLGIKMKICAGIPPEEYINDIAYRLAKRLIDEGYITIINGPGDYPGEAIIQARVDVVRRLEND